MLSQSFCMRLAWFSPFPPVQNGHRRLQRRAGRGAAARAGTSIDRVPRSRPRTISSGASAAARTTSSSTSSAIPRTTTMSGPTRCATRAWSCCTTRTCTTRARRFLLRERRARRLSRRVRVERAGRRPRRRGAGRRRLRQPAVLRLADGAARSSRARGWSPCTARRRAAS